MWIIRDLLPEKLILFNSELNKVVSIKNLPVVGDVYIHTQLDKYFFCSQEDLVDVLSVIKEQGYFVTKEGTVRAVQQRENQLAISVDFGNDQIESWVISDAFSV